MILVMTLAYARHDFTRECIEYFQARSDRDEYDEHVLVDPHYPIPSKSENTRVLMQMAEKYGLKYLSIPNRGVALNWQQVVENYNLGDGDVLVGVCPDARGEHKGWVREGVKVLRTDPDCYTVQLNRYGDYAPYRPEARVVGGVPVLWFPTLVAWSCGMFNMGLIKSIGGFDARNPWYGWSEHYLVDKFVPLGKRWYFLKDHYDAGLPSPDAEYTQWKILSAGGKVDVSFDDWYRATKPVGDAT